jgi:flagellar protein FlaI
MFFYLKENIWDYFMKIQNKMKKNNSLVPKYELTKTEFSKEEKKLLEELRNSLVDLAISSGDNFQINELALLNDIKDFLKVKLPVLDNQNLDYTVYSNSDYDSEINFSNNSDLDSRYDLNLPSLPDLDNVSKLNLI